MKKTKDASQIGLSISEKKKLNIIELCSGIGAQLRGLQNTGLFDVNVAATSEIDKDAVVSYAAIHCGLTQTMIDNYRYYPSMDEMRRYLTNINLGYVPEKDKPYDWYKTGNKFENNIKKYWLACQMSKNLGDVTRIDVLPKADVWFLSFPCQSISIAGKLKGMAPDSNTRSSLVWQTIRLLKEAQDTNTLPQFMMLENVKNLAGKKFISDFEAFNKLVEEFNYNVYWSVINAKNCGIPQNRERVFAVYVRKDIDTGNLTWPIPFDNGLRLKDMLDDNVDESYFINTPKAEELIQDLLDRGVIGNNCADEVETDSKNQLAYVSRPHDESNSPTASHQEQTVGLPIDNQKVPVYANYNKISKIDCDTARTILQRDYKGFRTSTETSNGVIENM